MKIELKMKRTGLYALAALTVLFVGCSDDEGNGGEQSGPGKGKIVFNVASPGDFVLRAASEGNEAGSPDDKVAFYQFSDKGTFERRYVMNYADAVSVDESNGARAYELDLTSSSGGEKRFVVVESADEENIPDMAEGDAMYDLLNSQTTAVEERLQPPFVMSNECVGSEAYVSVADVESTDNQVNVTLKRRVARFDLLNDPAQSGVIIDKVYVKNRRTRGFIGDVDGNAGGVSADVLEIPSEELFNGGKTFYLYPTRLTSTLEQTDRTVVWATTRMATADVEGPTLYLNLAADIDVEANRLYQLNTKSIAGSAGFDVTVKDWEDGSAIDWVTVEDGITLMDDKAELMEGTQIKGFYVKIGADASMPYTVRRVVTDYNDADLETKHDGELPSWLTVTSTTASAGSRLYRHEVVYTISERPKSDYQYAVTYLGGQMSDESLLTIGFVDPYPGTPLPVLSWSDKIYSPVHAGQSTYLTHNNVDKAYYCGAEAYTFRTDMSSMVNDVAANPCPEGWRTLNDAEAKDYILWVGEHLKTQETTSVYTYNWFDVAGEGTDLRILAGYPKSGSPTEKDLAAWGTWPNVAWVNIKLPDLTIQDQTFGDEWVIDGKYGIPYRCIREKDGWE